jgi:nucleolar GTP-binding protein
MRNFRLLYSIRSLAEWDLADPSWRYDQMPEIVGGKNVLDFIDPDIMQKLEELEVGFGGLSRDLLPPSVISQAEEEAREAAGEYDEELETPEMKDIRTKAQM